MRFPSANRPQPPTLPNEAVDRPGALEWWRRAFTGRQLPQPHARTLDQLPAALDERVRLIGEW